MGVHTLSDLPLYTIKGTTTDKEDISRIHMDVILVGMLTATLWRHIHHRTLQQLQESLLHTFTTHITGDGRVVALTGNLVDLVYEHDTTLCCLYIVVSHLEQTSQDTLHILTHITSLSKDSGIYNGKRHIEQFSDRTCQQRLTRTCRTHHDDITLLDFYTVFTVRLLQALVVVIDRYGKIAFRLILTNDIVVEISLDLLGLWYFLQLKLLSVGLSLMGDILLHNTICLFGTVLTDKTVQACDQQSYVLLTSATETTFFLHPSLSLPGQHCVNHTILLGLFCRHPIVTV